MELTWDICKHPWLGQPQWEDKAPLAAVPWEGRSHFSAGLFSSHPRHTHRSICHHRFRCAHQPDEELGEDR